MGCHLVLASTADEERRRLVRESLQAYNTRVCPDMESWEQPGHLDVYLLDAQGEVQGGLVAFVRWRWLEVHLLALTPELRRQGWGSRVLRLAEAEARKVGCTRCVLDTASFQARPFYEKLGYRLVGEYPNMLPGVGSYWLAKDLRAGGAEHPGAVVPGYELVACHGVDEAREKRVDEILMEFNVAESEVIRQAQESGFASDPLDVHLLDERGNLAGGLVAIGQFQTLFLRCLWIADGHRGQGWGQSMLELAEAEARRRGLTQVEGHIHGFQAPGFWQRLGYRNIGEIADFPPGHAFSWLMKTLEPKTAST